MQTLALILGGDKDLGNEFHVRILLLTGSRSAGGDLSAAPDFGQEEAPGLSGESGQDLKFDEVEPELRPRTS